MSIDQSLYQRSVKLNVLQNEVSLCHSLAHALIQTGRRWHGDTVIQKYFLRTEYQRARSRILRISFTELVRFQMLRIRTLNPNLIHVTRQLQQLRQCCRKCPMVNRNRLASGRPFVCLLMADDESVSQPFRFGVNEKGQIIEHN